jgi:glutamyl-tRNA reductase
MSGIVVGRALRNRFESIRQNELERLAKKMRGLPDDQRQSVEDITVDVVQAFARGAERALATDTPASTLDALVRLFALESEIR